MFATEPVTASLAGLLQDKDAQEKVGGVAGRPSRFVVQDENGQLQRRELEIDELEIQKGLLQVAQGLEFLHESAGLVHGNLTPDSIYVNAKVGHSFDKAAIIPWSSLNGLSLATYADDGSIVV